MWEGGASQAGCLRHPCLDCKDHTGEENALWGIGPRVWTLKTIGTKGARGSPTSPSLNYTEEPWVLTTVVCVWGGGDGEQSVNFFWTLGQLSLRLLKPWSALLLIPGLFPTIMGLSGWVKYYYFTHPLRCNGLRAIFLFFSWVSNHARVSLTPSGEWYTEQCPGLCFHKYGTNSF